MVAHEDFHPATTDYGLLGAPLARVSAAFETLFQGSHERSDLMGPPSDHLRRLAPLSMALDRKLLLSHGTWTAYFANGLLGSDVFGPVSRLAVMLGCTGLRVVRAPAATIIEVYESPERGGVPPLHYRRSIHAARDGRWSFGSEGVPYPFEDTSSFTAKRIRDRFTPAHLDRILDGLGAPLSPLPDDDVDGVLFTLADAAPHLKRWSFAEVQAGVPWQRQG